MRRFWGLLVNEHIKVILKTSTIIMLILVALGAVGLNAIFYTAGKSMSQSRNDSYYQQGKQDASMNQEQINILKSQKPEGWELDVQKYEYMIANKIGSGDWRVNAIEELYQDKKQLAAMQGYTDAALSAKVSKLQSVIDNNNFKSYMDIKIEETKNNTELSGKSREAALFALNYQKSNNIYNFSSWQYQSLLNYQQAVSTSEQFEKTPPKTAEEQASFKQAKKSILVEKYRLDHNLEKYIGNAQGNSGGIDYWSAFAMSASTISFISMLIIIIAGSSISGEFSQGTIKFLLINPIKRWKILAAKYVSVLTSAVIMATLFYIVNAIFAGLFLGFGDLGMPYLAVTGNTVFRISGFLYVAKLYLFGMVGMITVATMAFMLSSLVRSSSLSIGIGVFALLGSASAMAILANFQMDWARYILFANTNLEAVANGNTMFPNQTLTFAICVIVVYMVVFLLTAYDAFTRRDIK